MAVQALNATGESKIGVVSLKTMWTMLKTGNKAVKHHSNLAAEDPFRQGVGISQLADTLLAAFAKIKSEKVKQVIREDIYAKAMKEIDTLTPHPKVLNAGPRKFTRRVGVASLRSSASSSSAEPPAPPVPPEDAARSARGIHAWLMLPTTPARGLLSLIGAGGVFYAAQVQDRAARAYVEHGGITVDDFIAAVQLRLASPDGEEVAEADVDDTVGLFS